jgi:hypothetical protein
MKKILIFNHPNNIKLPNKNIPIDIKGNSNYNNIQNMYEYKLNNIYKYEIGKDIHLIYSETDINNINYIINIIEDIYTNYNKNKDIFNNLLINNFSKAYTNKQILTLEYLKTELYYALFLLYILLKLYYTFIELYKIINDTSINTIIYKNENYEYLYYFNKSSKHDYISKNIIINELIIKINKLSENHIVILTDITNELKKYIETTCKTISTDNNNIDQKCINII